MTASALEYFKGKKYPCFVLYSKVSTNSLEKSLNASTMILIIYHGSNTYCTQPHTRWESLLIYSIPLRKKKNNKQTKILIHRCLTHSDLLFWIKWCIELWWLSAKSRLYWCQKKLKQRTLGRCSLYSTISRTFSGKEKTRTDAYCLDLKLVYTLEKNMLIFT